MQETAAGRLDAFPREDYHPSLDMGTNRGQASGVLKLIQNDDLMLEDV